MLLGGLQVDNDYNLSLLIFSLSELKIITQAFHCRTVTIPFKLEPPRANKLPHNRFIILQTTRILRD